MCACARVYSGNEILDFSASGIPQFLSRVIAREERNDGGIQEIGWRVGKKGIYVQDRRVDNFLCVYIYIYSNETVCVPLLPCPGRRFKSTVAYIINVPLSSLRPPIHYHRRHFVCFYRLRSPFYPFSLFSLLFARNVYPAGSMCAF